MDPEPKSSEEILPEFTPIIVNNRKNSPYLLSDDLIVFPQFLSVEECADIIEFSIKLPKTTTRSTCRQRSMFRSSVLADYLFTEIKKLSREVCIKMLLKPQHQDDQWTPSYINNNFRFVTSEAGTGIGPHFDATYVVNVDEISIYTAMIYLNDNFTGGLLDFNNTSYIPQQGDLVILNQRLLHSSPPVKTGTKYILRSEIMYRRVGTVETDSDREAMVMYNRARQTGDEYLMDRAFILSPRLENLVLNI